MTIKLIHAFNRFDVNSEKKEETFSGDNYQEVFKDIYRCRKPSDIVMMDLSF